MSANSADAVGINQLLAIKYNHQNNSLELVDDDINNEEVADVLFDLATTYSDVTYLNLSGNELNEDGVSILAGYVPNLPNLTALNLDANDEIDDSGLAEISHAVSVHPSITSLSFSSCDIVDGIVFFENLFANSKSLYQFNLANNNLGDEGADCIFNAISRNNHSAIGNLNFADNNFTDQAVIESINPYLSESSTLRVLSLAFNDIEDDGVQSLAQALRSNNMLKELGLRKNRFSEIGTKFLFSALKANSSLEKIDLSDNALGREGAGYIADYLKTNGSLKIMFLDDISPSDEGFSDIAAALAVNKKVICLSFEKNLLNNADIIKLADAIGTHPSLLELDLSSNSIGNIGLAALAKGLIHNTKLSALSLRRNEFTMTPMSWLIPSPFTEPLRLNKSLKYLDLSSNNFFSISRPFIDSFMYSHLRELDLSNNKIGAQNATDIIEMLCVNNSLRKVKLSNNKFGAWSKSRISDAVDIVNHGEVPDQIRPLACVNKFMQKSVEYCLDRHSRSEPELTPFGSHYLRLNVNGRKKQKIRLDHPFLVKLPVELLVQILGAIVGERFLKKRESLEVNLGFGY